MNSVIVIGGGIAGCSTAHAFAQRGGVVTLIERHATLAKEASGNPIAVLYPKLNSTPSLQNDLTIAGFSTSLTSLKNLPSDPTLFHACGIIQLAFNSREKVRQTRLLQQKTSMEIHHVTAKQASTYAGVDLGEFEGVWLPQAAWVNPTRWCEELTKNIIKILSTEALKINKIASGWQVTLGKSVLEAKIVVICNANDISRFAQCASAKITTVRGQINLFTENSASQNLKSIVCSDHFVSPAVSGLHQIGTTYAPNELNPNITETDTQENLQALRKISTTLFNCVSKTTGRVAWRSQTLDYIPLAGQLLDENKLRASPPRYNTQPANLPWLEGLYVNAGHGSKGMITAPICGELIAQLANNETLSLNEKLISALNPSRFLLRELGLKQLSKSLYR